MYISKGYFYKYQLVNTKRNEPPLLNIDELEKFVEDREYLAIPEVFPDDYGKIPTVPSPIDKFIEFV